MSEVDEITEQTEVSPQEQLTTDQPEQPEESEQAEAESVEVEEEEEESEEEAEGEENAAEGEQNAAEGDQEDQAEEEESEEEVEEEESEEEEGDKEDQQSDMLQDAPTAAEELENILVDKEEEIKFELINTQLTIEDDCPVDKECIYTKALIEEVSTNDIPERLQSVFEDRLDPSDNELKCEAKFISYHLNKDSRFAELKESKKKNLLSAVYKVLEEYRRRRNDMPFIHNYRSYLMMDILKNEDLWKIASLDLQWKEYCTLENSIKYLLNKVENQEAINELDKFIEASFGEIESLKLVKQYLLYKLSDFSESFDNRIEVYQRNEFNFTDIIQQFYSECFISP